MEGDSSLMMFRVKYSTDIDEYYKDTAEDIQFIVTVEADSFRDAQDEADGMLVDYVLTPNRFDVVELVRIDN
jgi:hypothetical protein